MLIPKGTSASWNKDSISTLLEIQGFTQLFLKIYHEHLQKKNIPKQFYLPQHIQDAKLNKPLLSRRAQEKYM